MEQDTRQVSNFELVIINTCILVFKTCRILSVSLAQPCITTTTTNNKAMMATTTTIALEKKKYTSCTIVCNKLVKNPIASRLVWDHQDPERISVNPFVNCCFNAHQAPVTREGKIGSNRMRKMQQSWKTTRRRRRLMERMVAMSTMLFCQ